MKRTRQELAGRLGDLLFVGFDGTETTVELRSFLTDVRPGGIILFKRNLAEPEQTIRLIADLHGLYEPSPIVAVDEEGGQVSRVRPMAPTLPPAGRMAASGDAALVRSGAASLGRILAALGFDLDFAPVVDLCRPDAPNGIGDRSFGLDPERASVMAAAWLDGMGDAGITGCLKHFPGLGPTLFDSHHHLPTVQKEASTFLQQDLHPFRELSGRVPVVMIGHGHYPFLSGPDPIAATLSPEICTDLLRRQIGFTGVALADDLEMKAVSARISFDELAPRAIGAGCDMVLVCRRRDLILASLEALQSWLAAGRLDERRVAEALDRVDALRQAVGRLRGRREGSPSAAAFRTASDELGARLQAMA